MYEIPTGIATNQTRTHTVTALALSTVAAHVGGAWAGGFGFLFLLIPLFWIGLFVLIFAIAGRRWRRNAWAGGYGPWGHHMSATRSAETPSPSVSPRATSTRRSTALVSRCCAPTRRRGRSPARGG